MSLNLHRAERSDVLVQRLADVLAAVPADPFTRDVVAVPSRGVERWIAQSLSSTLGAGPASDGVCANVVFPSPGRLVREALAAASGIEPDDDPWEERRLPWPLLEVIDACAGEDWCRTLGRHLGLVGERGLPRASGPGRRMAVAQKLAGLFTTYGSERPSMLQAWRDGRDEDGYGEPLDPDLVWQAELWRRLRTHLDVPSPAERIGPACERLRAERDLVDLPERLSIFGPTRLTTAQLAVVDALADQRDLHLWLPHPSDGLWQHVSAGVDGEAIATRRADGTAALVAHPLARSLGRDAREMQVRLGENTSARTDEHVAAPTTPDTLLGVLQHDLHADASPRGDHALAADDHSVQVHACHGRHRQVEVLREVVLGLLEDDPTLELRDLIVMCPDIEAYAPLISASFGVEVDGLERTDGFGGPDGLEQTDGLGGGESQQPHPGHRLTFRLADRSLRQTNPVLGVAARLLELADARLTASEVLDLVAVPPVRRRFRLDDDALERVGDWVRRAGVRWGMDADARGSYGLAGLGQNTWESGLDRILTGVVMDEEDLRTIGSALPLDDVDSTEIDLAGRLTEMLDRIGAALDALGREQSLDDWIRALDDAVDSLVDVAPSDAWQVTQARAVLAGAVAAAGDGGSATRLRLSDVRALLGDRLRGRPTRANFRTGHLTICTMVPMRSVPHRVVCLLGLDDGVFPRGTRVDGDDVLARRPRVGERDRRSEDRQLFLDAIVAAKEKLVILYTGADERTGAERPPAVPLGELLDVLDRTAVVPPGAAGAGSPGATTADAPRVRDRVVVRHPLQPFDARNFEPGRLAGADPFSFDAASYAGSVAMRDGQREVAPFLSGPLPAVSTGSTTRDGSSGGQDTVELEKLIRFLEHPVRGFLQQRLDLRTADEEDQPSDAVPVAPDKLEEWAVGDRLLRSGLRGRSGRDAVTVELLRGELPPGRLGHGVIDPIADNVAAILEKTQRMLSVDAQTIDLSVSLPSGVTLAGTVPRVYGDRPIRIEYSKLSPKHRIRAWVQLLALAASDPDRSWRAAVVGRGPNTKDPVIGSFMGGVSAEEAQGHLDELVRIYALGLTRPLPAPPKTSCAYASARARNLSPENACAIAGKEWRMRSKSGAVWGEFDDGDHRRVGFVDLEHLLADPPDAVPLDNPDDEPHVFGLLATAIWAPLLAHEDLTG